MVTETEIIYQKNFVQSSRGLPPCSILALILKFFIATASGAGGSSGGIFPQTNPIFDHCNQTGKYIDRIVIKNEQKKNANGGKNKYN